VTTEVLLATCDDMPGGDPDEAGLVGALAERGIAARWQSWTADAAWDAPTVLRSTWDYAARREEFLAWTRSVGVLHNPAGVVAWNSDKVYLADVAAAGVPVTPTEWVAPGEPWAGTEHAEFVVKPSVGAGSRGAGRFVAAELDKARAHVAHLHEEGRTAMVQPYLAGVDRAGEAALIFIDGRFSHAVTKGPMLPSGTVHRTDGYVLFVEEQITPREPSTAERDVAEAALAVVTARFGTLLYARLDLLPGDDGPVVVEVELTEPSLFLGRADGATERFADALAGRLA
jgi:glutathione synthase/RimK-type ligase-like ATP-grasp enzyme